MKKLVHFLQSNQLIYNIILIVLFIITINYRIFSIVILIYSVYFHKKIKFKILIPLFILIVIIYIFTIGKYVPNNVSSNFLIVDRKKYDYTYLYTIKSNGLKYNIYIKEYYKIGTYLNVNGHVKPFDSIRIPNGFNARQYYLSNGIVGVVENYTLNDTFKSNYLYSLSIKNYSSINPYINVLFGNNILDREITDSLKNLNAIHYLSLSGIHIYMIFGLLNFLFERINISIDKQVYIKLSILILVLMISTYSIVILRILIYEILKLIKNKNNIKITNFSILNITFLFLIFINPYNIINQSFLIMFLITNIISLLSPMFEKNIFIIKSLKISLIVSFILLPFTNEINIIGIILSPLMTISICYIIIPLSLLITFFPHLLFPKTIITFIEKFYLEGITTTFKINIGKLIPVFILGYFILMGLLITLKRKKKILITLTLLLIMIFPSIVIKVTDSQLYFLDVGQGDSSVYISQNNIVVIDAFKGVSDFLKNKGINQIDYLILTHSDDDHIFEANKILDNFNVSNIIISEYDNEYNLKVQKNLLIQGRSGLNIKSKELEIVFYGPIVNLNNKNDNSLVFKLSYENQSVLFTGDIGIKAEEELIHKYSSTLKSNILKVAHHGSNTSSSYFFIDTVSPKIAIISVGLDNKYNLPDIEVINLLNSKRINIYQTRYDKTIKIYKQKVLLMD